MKASIGKNVLIAPLSAASPPGLAQAQNHSGPVVELDATVPPVLLVSIDESSGSSLALIGVLDLAARKVVQGAGQRYFDLGVDRPCDRGSFTISQNGALELSFMSVMASSLEGASP
ncbi:MAG: hypothetical protein NT061_11720 [Spirochaetes bacterium]|nr:hypothetical protein [Spirochaetota bacterium]